MFFKYPKTTDLRVFPLQIKSVSLAISRSFVSTSEDHWAWLFSTKKRRKKWLSTFTEKYTSNQNMKREIQTSREYSISWIEHARGSAKGNKNSKREREREENRVHSLLYEIRISFWRWISDRGSDGADVSFRLSKSFQFLESRAFRPDWIISANAAWKRDSKRSRQYDKRQPPPRVHSWTTPFERSPIPSRDGGGRRGRGRGWYSRSTDRSRARGL